MAQENGIPGGYLWGDGGTQYNRRLLQGCDLREQYFYDFQESIVSSPEAAAGCSRQLLDGTRCN